MPNLDHTPWFLEFFRLDPHLGAVLVGLAITAVPKDALCVERRAPPFLEPVGGAQAGDADGPTDRAMRTRSGGTPPPSMSVEALTAPVRFGFTHWYFGSVLS